MEYGFFVKTVIHLQNISIIFNGRNEVVAKVMLLLVSVILSTFRYTVNERPVRILLECILVIRVFEKFRQRVCCHPTPSTLPSPIGRVSLF